MNKIPVIIAAVIGLLSFSCASPETENTNKVERNAVKRGIENFDEKNFSEAVEDFSEAMEANPNSERARYNHALAMLHRELADTADHPEDRDLNAMADSTKLTPRQEALKAARETLLDLSKKAESNEVADGATYNLANDSYWLGDALMKQAEATQQSDPQTAYQFSQTAVECFKRAAELYKVILRQKPNDTQALQNLYITLLRIPPEDDNQQQQQQNQQNQQQQQNQDNQDQDKKDKPQPQNQQEQNEEEKSQALKALENREQQMRRQRNDKGEKTPVRGKRQIKKPW